MAGATGLSFSIAQVHSACQRTNLPSLPTSLHPDQLQSIAHLFEMSFTLPRTMKAYRFKPPATRPVVEVVDLPSPAEDEVLLNVLAAGLCHTDLSLLEPGNMVNASATARAPFTVGHEGAGVCSC